MKIGMSLGKCLRDIVNGTVPYSDVYLIIARTNAEDLTGMIKVVDYYLCDPTRLGGLDEEKCKEIASRLWNDGKIHQPRSFGGFTFPVSDEYLWMDLMPSVAEMSPMVKDAWDNYRMLLSLTVETPIPENTPGHY